MNILNFQIYLRFRVTVGKWNDQILIEKTFILALGQFISKEMKNINSSIIQRRFLRHSINCIVQNCTEQNCTLKKCTVQKCLTIKVTWSFLWYEFMKLRIIYFFDFRMLKFILLQFKYHIVKIGVSYFSDWSIVMNRKG